MAGDVPPPTLPAVELLPEVPRVSLLVAMRNESAAIGACLASIAQQDYPADALEVLVFDGASADDSVAIAERAMGGRRGWRLLANPRRIQASAWNLGISASTGEVIGIISGHAALDPGYVREAVETLRRTGADMVGGPVRAIGEGVVATAIAIGMSTRFGVGGAQFRYLDREQDVDTVFMGLARRALWGRFPFDEAMVRNQDDELSYRLQDAGARIVCNPAIQSSYRSRATLGGLVGQYFDYGFWKAAVLRKHPAQARFRHIVPSLLVASLAGGLILGFAWRPILVLAGLAASAYLVTNLVASWSAGRSAGWRVVAILPAVYASLHLSYGAGLLVGIARHPRWPVRSVQVVARALAGRAMTSGAGVRE